jgi:hypothetical protein
MYDHAVPVDRAVLGAVPQLLAATQRAQITPQLPCHLPYRRLRQYPAVLFAAASTADEGGDEGCVSAHPPPAAAHGSSPPADAGDAK